MTCSEVKPLLGGYLDGELDLVHSLELEEHLGHCESCSQALRAAEEVSGAVSAAPRYPAGRQLRARLTRQPGHRLWQHPAWAAAAATVILGSVALWRIALPAIPPEAMLEREVVQNHIRSLMANHLLDMPSSDTRAVQPWFRGRLDYAPLVEDISAHGFELAGGRLDYLDGRAVAALVYRKGPHVVNVFVWPAPGQKDRAASVRMVDGFNVVGWRTDGMNWWAVSDLGPVELEELPLCPCFMFPRSTLHASVARADGKRGVSRILRAD